MVSRSAARLKLSSSASTTKYCRSRMFIIRRVCITAFLADLLCRSAVPCKACAMDIRQLRVAVTVAEHLHFGRAAQALGVGQSTVSEQVRALENGLGVEIFARSS